MTHSYINLEEKLNTWFDNPISVGANSSRPTGNESHQQKDESNQGIQNWHDKLTSLNTSHENIYQECANTKFQNGGTRTPFPI